MLSLSALIYSETIQLVCISTPSKTKSRLIFYYQFRKKGTNFENWNCTLFLINDIQNCQRADWTLKFNFALQIE